MCRGCSAAAARSAPAVLVVLAALLLAAPVAAQSGPSAQRAGRRGARSSEAQRLADGRGIRTGRELSVALAQLAAAARRPQPLRPRGGRPAARPPDRHRRQRQPAARTAAARASCAPARRTSACTGSTRPHDAPAARRTRTAARRPTTSTHDADRVRAVLRASRTGSSAGGPPSRRRHAAAATALTDVYLKQLNEPGDGHLRLRRHRRPAATGAQPAPRTWCSTTTTPPTSSRSYGGSSAVAAAGHGGARVQPRAPVRLRRRSQDTVDVRVDRDLGRGQGLRRRSTTTTATWARWADTPAQPITSASGALKMYGSAIWNHWLEHALRGRRGPARVGRSPGDTSRRLRAGRLRPRDPTHEAGGTSFAGELRRPRGRHRPSGTRADSGIQRGIPSFPGEVGPQRHPHSWAGPRPSGHRRPHGVRPLHRARAGRGTGRST